MSILDRFWNASPKAKKSFAEGAAKIARDWVLKYGIEIEKYANSIGVYEPDADYKLGNMYVMLRDYICKYYYMPISVYYSILEEHGIKVPFRMTQGNESIYSIGRTRFEETDFFQNCECSSVDEAMYKLLNSLLKKDN